MGCVAGGKLGGLIAEVLGVEHCKKMTLVFETNKPATVIAECCIEEDKALALPALLEEYELVEKK